MRNFLSVVFIVILVLISGCDNKTVQQKDEFSHIMGAWKSEETGPLNTHRIVVLAKDNAKWNKVVKQVSYFYMAENIIGVHPLDAPAGLEWISIKPQSDEKILVQNKTFGMAYDPYVKITMEEAESLLNAKVVGPNSKPISVKR